MLRLSIIGISLVLSSSPIMAQEEPVEIGQVEAGTEVYNVESLRPPPTNGVLKISGEKIWNSFLISAERIEFEPGSKLIFSSDAIAMRGNLFILSNEIVSLSEESPGTISWAAPPLSTPPDRGSAPSAGGYPGDEQTGNPGPNGGSGNQGYPGASGPTLTMVIGKPSSPVVIDLSGQLGGYGGKGEDGGRGGVGGNGRQGSQGGFGCLSGAGDGGRGGPGGQGGPGGVGGTGGSGGTFKLITSQENLPLASSVFRVRLSPGQGGESGNPGNGGPGGDGGQGGKESLPYCRGNGSNGQPGAPGHTGSAGATGAPGQPGDYIIGGISVDDLKRVLQD